MIFTPGDEVVCVDDVAHPEWSRPDFDYYEWERPVVAGQHYVVRWVGFHFGNPCLKVAGVVRQGCDDPLRISRFRPARRETIEIFRAMCVSTKPLVEV